MRLTMLAERLFKDSFVWGALLTARWAPRGVRFHPTSRIFGDADRVHIGPGAKVRGRVTLRTTGEGRIELGPRTWLADDVSIDTDRIVEVGADTTIQVRSSLNGRVAIGRGCLLAPGVFASSGTHVFRQWPELPIRIQERLAAETPELADRFDRPVVIEDDCWIGVNAVINPGVTIGKGAVIGANAVVTRDVRPYSVVAGVPAQPVSKRLDWKPPRCLDATAAEAVPYLCGVDIQVEGATVSATLDGSATIALEAATGGRIGIEVEASRTAGLIVGAERHRLTPGRNRLQIGGIAAFLSGRFGVPHLQLPVALAADDSTPVRLLVAEWIPDRSPEPVADWRQSTP